MRRAVYAIVAEPVVVSFILLATVALFASGFVPDGSRAHDMWMAVDFVCVGFFLLEMFIKLARDGVSGYFASRWNRFDCAIAVLSAPVLLLPVVGEVKIFAGVPVLRLARLFRLFRLLRFIPDRDHIAAGIVRALKASVGVFVAVGLVNFIFAMGAHLLFSRTAPQYFGNPAISCYSMFQVFTIEGWYEIPAAIARGTGSDFWAVFGRLYFGTAVLVGGILGLSLANAVFVDQMIVDNTNEIDDRIDTLVAEVRALRNEIVELRSERRE